MRIGFGLAALAAVVATPAMAKIPAGIWSNPANSVHVAFKSCGRAMCGTVVWANAKAQADAERGGTDRLVGERLFEDFVEDGPGQWSGGVYVPDIGKTVEGTITQIDDRTLTGEGCLFAGFGCKQQTWKRIK